MSYTGKKFQFNENYLLVVNHPVSTENKNNNLKNIDILLRALPKIQMHKVMFWPNADAYSDTISSKMRSLEKTIKKMILLL